jgi:hypothetical protein
LKHVLKRVCVFSSFVLLITPLKYILNNGHIAWKDSSFKKVDLVAIQSL